MPGFGARLQRPWPDLPFGLSEQEVRRLIEPHGGVTSSWACRTEWALGFPIPGGSVGLSASAHEGGRGLLDCVWVDRWQSATEDAWPVEPWPVGFMGVDVFGWPADDVMQALREQGVPVPASHHGTARIGELRLSREPVRPEEPSGRKKPRRPEPYFFAEASLQVSPSQ